MNAAAIDPAKTVGTVANLDRPAALSLARWFGLFEMETAMQRTVLAAAATLAILAGATLAPQPAEAMPGAPAGLTGAVTAAPLAQHVAYECHLVWRCGRYGCGWRRVCYRTAPRPYRTPRYYYRRYWYRW